MKSFGILITVFPLLTGMLFLSCARHIPTQGTAGIRQIYPQPPDTARIQFLTSISGSENITAKQSGFSRFLFGESEIKTIKKPYGIATVNGKLFICDTGLGGLEIIDLDRGKFEYFNPAGEGQLKGPVNCFADADGMLYVADIGREQIVVFDAAGKFLKAFGESQMFKPTDVFVTDDKIWVANLKESRVNVYSKESYDLMYHIPNSDTSAESRLFSPTNIVVSDDKVWVSDMGDFKIKVYSHKGRYLYSIGGSGSNIGQFVRPKGIAVDHESNLYAVDAGFENVQIFNKDGKVLMFFGGPYKGPGDMWLPAKVTIDYDNLSYFGKYVDHRFRLKYLIYVTNQFGPDKVNVYGAVSLK